MRAVAGSMLILGASILLAATRLAARMTGPVGPDDGVLNLILIGGAIALGLFGFGVPNGGLAGDRRALPPPAGRPLAPAGRPRHTRWMRKVRKDYREPGRRSDRLFSDRTWFVLVVAGVWGTLLAVWLLLNLR